MDPVELCRQTLLELRERGKNRTEYDVGKMAALLRQLLFDKHAVLRTAAKVSGKKFFFHTGNIQFKKDIHDQSPHYILFTPGDMNPWTGERHLVSVDDYGGLLAMLNGTHVFSVREVVKFVANKRGGVHLDSDMDGDETALDELSKDVEINGSDCVMAQVIHIADNTVKSAVACGWID